MGGCLLCCRYVAILRSAGGLLLLCRLSVLLVRIGVLLLPLLAVEIRIHPEMVGIYKILGRSLVIVENFLL